VNNLPELEFPDGTVHAFDALGRLSQIRDRFGNAATVTQQLDGWSISDGHRTQRVYTTAVAGQTVVDRVELAAFDGTPAVYQLGYTATTIWRDCPHTDPAYPKSLTVPLLTGVTLPDGSTWAPGYHLGSSAADCGVSGKLASLRLPTLGSVEWAWQPYSFPPAEIDKRPWRTNSFGVASRKTRSAAGALLGTWTYQTQLTPTGTFPPVNRELVNTAIDPLGHRTVRYFSVFTGDGGSNDWTNHEYGLQLSRSETDGAGRFVSERVYDAAGALQRSAWVRYERDQAMSSVVPLQDRTNLNRRMASSRTTFHDDGNRYATSDSAGFDGLGHHRTTTTGGDFAAGNVRAATRNWNPARGTYAIDPATNQPGPGHSFSMLPASSPWILGTATFEQATEGSQTARATLCYDADGLLVRKRIHRDSGTAESVGDVLVTYAYTLGNLTNERWYGGDVQALTANGTTCSMALPANDQYGFLFTYPCGVPASSAYTTPQNAEFAFRNVDRTIHCASGLPASSRDVAGLATEYEYDDLGRLAWEKPESGHDGWTEYVYTRATTSSALANVLVRRRNNGSKSATVLAESRLTFDALGRVWKEEQKLPNGTWNLRETLYDALGQKASVSEVGAASKKTVFSSYDPFGRPGTVTPADGAAHAVTFSYQGVREVSRTVKIGTAYNATTGAVTEASSTTTELYDRQGRLHQVTEPSGSAGAHVTTTYGYDVGNRLASVSTVSASGTQTRAFSYDQRGFLTSERHPEKGASGNGTVTYQSYDARGHAGRKIDGPNDLTFSYERAERLSGVQETGGRQLKTFGYAGTNSGTDKRLGKLVTATRYNYPVGLTVPVVETYSYRGRGGRVSARETQTTVNGALETHFSQGFSYTPLGQVQTLTYPDCLAGGCDTNTAVFADVPVGHPQKAQIEGIYRAGITVGCAAGSPPSYCPGGNVTRAEMAVFLLRSAEGPGYTPPACVTPTFSDVACSYWAAAWIEELYRRGITTGCATNPLRYCPTDPVSPAQMSAFLLRSIEGVGYQPPACTTPTYADVPCTYWAARWIEEATRRAITSGCGGANFCPDSLLLRRDMAVWLTNGFQVPNTLDPVLPRTVTHTYSQGLLTQVVGYGTLGYHPNLLVSQVSHANGVTDTQSNDPNSMRRPRSISSASSGLFASGWSSGNYLYDGAGNVTRIGSAWFTYDKVSRLTEGRVYLGPYGGGAQKWQTYTFDPFGNITTIGGTSGRSTPTSAATNRLTGTGTAYDPAGNLTAWNGATYQYDGFNQMTRMTNGGEDWLYLYTADDERIWSYSLNANLSRWTVRDLSGKVLREWENHQNQYWGIAADTLYRDGQLLAAETGNGRKHFHLDHLGTPRLLTNAVGQKLAYHVYYPFGEEATEFNQDRERMKFTGHERDLGSLAGAGDDLDYMHARFYSPITSRFLSVDRDPRFLKAIPQRWNRYSYTSNSPLGFYDPDGNRQNPVTGGRGIDPTPQRGAFGKIRATNSNKRMGLFGFTRKDSSGRAKFHSGVDINAQRGTLLFSAEAGKISDIGNRGAGGSRIQVTTKDGTVLTYSHLDSFTAGLEKGTVVAEGQILGKAGTTGKCPRAGI
jgi:RHS repeat-associated protein